MFADGLGHDPFFELWVPRFLTTFDNTYGYHGVAMAWAACQQEARRVFLAAEMCFRAPNFNWLGYVRARKGCKDASVATEFRQPRQPLPKALFAATIAELSVEVVAAGRLLSGGPAFWSTEQEIGYLDTWPVCRRLTGLKIQGNAASGCPVETVQQVSVDILKASGRVDEEQAHNLARDLAHNLMDDFTSYLSADLSQDYAQNFATDLACDSITWVTDDITIETSEVARELARDIARDSATYLASYVGRAHATGVAHDYAPELAYNIASNWNLDPLQHDWLFNFATIEARSVGRVTGRALLAANRSVKAPPTAQLLSPACRLTNGSVDADLAEFNTALDQHGSGLHPLWTALARHLARRATEADRTLLESLARDPSQIEDGPLRWGLRFIVRGDVMLPDGSFVTLDELCDQAGLPHLPYLEDPPEPLDVDWDV